ISSQIFLGTRKQGFFVHRDYAKVAASQRTGPSRTDAQPFLIFEHLAGKGQEGAEGFAALHSDESQKLNGSFDCGQHLSCRDGGGRVVEGLGYGVQEQNLAIKTPDQRAGNADRSCVALDGEDATLKTRSSNAAKRLQRMQGAYGGAQLAYRSQHVGSERTAGVQDKVLASVLGANVSKLLHHGLNR